MTEMKTYLPALVTILKVAALGIWVMILITCLTDAGRSPELTDLIHPDIAIDAMGQAALSGRERAIIMSDPTMVRSEVLGALQLSSLFALGWATWRIFISIGGKP